MNYRQTGKMTVLYSRLSRDDELQGPSNSIVNQQELLQEYAERHGLRPYVHISDDGYSGTGWDRPGWRSIMDEIDRDNVYCIVFKDLTRFGRDYLRVGLYMEMFREKGVRLVAINDGIDTDRGEDDFTPFRAIMAEWYARDTSRKIKSVLHKKGRDGKPMCNTPIYGFRKAPNEKDVWVIDEEAADIVRRIFLMTVDGIGPYVIAQKLSEDRVERPSYHLYSAGIQATAGKCNLELPYSWRGNVVSKLLQQREYMGDLVNFKCNKPSFKSKKVVANAPEDQIVFPDALPAIVDRDTWELAQKLRKTRRTPSKGLPPNPLTGLLFCFDCGGKMSNRRRTLVEDKYGNPVPQFDSYECSTYRNSKRRQIDRCSVHHTNSADVRAVLLETIRCVCAYAKDNEAEFVDRIRKDSIVRHEVEAAAHLEQIDKNKARLDELDMYFRRAYEDNIKGKLSDERFFLLSEMYDDEQSELAGRNNRLQAEIDVFNDDNTKIDKFLELTRRYIRFDKLTTPMLNEFVDRVLVHSADKSSGERVQELDVYLRFIGKFGIPAPELSQKETEANERRLAKKRREQEYNRRRYAESKKIH